MAFDLGSAVVEIGTSGTGKLAAGLNAAKGVVVGFGSAFTAALGPVAALIAGVLSIKEAIGAAAEGEAAVTGLAAALRANGQEVDGNVESAKAFANEIMAVTRTGDEAVLGMLKYGVNLGLTAAQSQEMAKASIGLATALGIDAQGAMKMLTLESQGNASALEKQIPALKGVEDQATRLAIIQRTAASGMQQEMEMAKTAGGVWEQLKNSVGELAETLGSALLPMVVAGAENLKMFIDWIATGISTISEFGFQGATSFGGIGSSLSWLGGVASSVFGAITGFLGELLFAVLNWDLSIQTLGLTFAETFTNVWNHVKAFGENVVNVASWMFDNWKQIFETIYNFTTTVFTNIGKNIWDFFSNIPGLIKGTVGFADIWTPLTDGFESAISEMPNIVAAQKADFSKEWRGLDKEWDERTKKWNEISAKNAGSKTKEQIEKEMATVNLPTIGQAAAETEKKAAAAKGKGVGAAAKGATSDAGSFKSITSAWKDAQSALLKSQEKTPEKLLAESEKQTGELEKINKNIERMNGGIVLA